MQAQQLEFRFKGDRDYIHGTDMFDALVGVHPPAILGKVYFTIHGLVRTPVCDVYRADSQELLGADHDIKVRARYERAGVTRWVALRESSASGPPGRYAYDEGRINSLCDVQDYRIVLKNESPFTFIETVVAMNKYMHQKLFPGAVGKWLFTGIDLERGCDARGGISLQIGRNVNYRLTRSEIVRNGQVIGNLLFSLVRQ